MSAHHHHAIRNEKRLLRALLMIGAFTVVEIVGGIVSGSLALLADAGHMLADAAALGLAWLAFRTGRRPADPKRSYGYHRFQVLAAFVNGAMLLVIVGWIVFEAVSRLAEPPPVNGGIMVVVAALGLLANLAALRILGGAGHANLNMRAAAYHVLGDLLASVAVVAAGIVVLATGWLTIDPLLGLVVAVLILRTAWPVIKQASHILLEGTPDEFDAQVLARELLAAVPAAQDIHHVHAWALTDSYPVITLHARIGENADVAETLGAIKDHLRRSLGIEHSTVQLETGPCLDEG